MSPATYSTKGIGTRHRVTMYDFDPDVTTVVAVSWQPIALYRKFLAMFMRTIGISAVTFDIAAATSSGGAGATQVVAHAVASEPDAVGDYIHLAVDAEQIREVLAGATHWSARLSVATATDEGAVAYVESDPYYSRDGLTADNIA